MNNANKKIEKLLNESDGIINDGIKKFEKRAERLQRDYYD